MARGAGTASLLLARDRALIETRRGLPGDPDDAHSRYIEAAVDGMLIGCLYLPNGNPAPGPKFDYKLRWFDRLAAHAAELLATGMPVVAAGDFNVMPTELDLHKPERWVDDALFRSEVREAFHRLLAQGWTDALRELHPGERIYTFWDYFRNAWARNAGLRIDHVLLSPSIVDRLAAAGVDRHCDRPTGRSEKGRFEPYRKVAAGWYCAIRCRMIQINDRRPLVCEPGEKSPRSVGSTVGNGPGNVPLVRAARLRSLAAGWRHLEPWCLALPQRQNGQQALNFGLKLEA
jgi:exodeoxyribonuclease III